MKLFAKTYVFVVWWIGVVFWAVCTDKVFMATHG
jgi:hypothetical protein